MSLDDLYQEVIVDHSKRPRNYGELDAATHCCEGHNPLCGDNVTIYLQIKNGMVESARFAGNGCAISTASASMMTEAVIGKSVKDVEALFNRFRNLMTTDEEPGDESGLGSLESLMGVREYPMRVKCATLPWHALHAALQRRTDGQVSTE